MLRENAAATAATSRLRVVVLLRLCSDSAGAVAVFTWFPALVIQSLEASQ